MKITLPDNSHKSAKAAQDKFEEMLVDYGLLKTGAEAASDEISRSISEDAAATANSIRQTTAEYVSTTLLVWIKLTVIGYRFLKENPPTDSPATFPETAHALASGTSSATSTIYNAAQSVSAVVSSAASSAGAFISTSVGAGPPSPSTKEAVSSLADAYNSVAKGVGEVKHAVTDSFGDVVQNEVGQEARDIGGKVVGTVGNVGGAVGQVAEVGTGAVLVSGGVKGVVGLGDDGAADETDEDFVNSGAGTQPPVEEMTTFAIEEKDGDGDWKEVTI